MHEEPRITSFPGKLPHPFRLLLFVEYPSGYFSRLHEHDVYQDVLVLQGCFTFEFTDKAPMLLTPGRLGVVPPACVHSWQAVSRTTCRTMIVTHEPFACKSHRELSQAFGENTTVPLHACLQMQQTKSLVESLWAECINTRPAGTSLVYGLLVQLLALAARHFLEEIPERGKGRRGNENEYAK